MRERCAWPWPPPSITSPRGADGRPRLSIGGVLDLARGLHHADLGLEVLADRADERGHIHRLLPLARLLPAALPGLELPGLRLVELLLRQLPGLRWRGLGVHRGQQLPTVL